MPSMETAFVGGCPVGACDRITVKANVYRCDDGRQDGGNVELMIGGSGITMPIWDAVRVAEMLLTAARTVAR